MTRDEASDILADFFYWWVSFPKCNDKIFNYRKLEETIKMAIEALEQPEIIRCKDCKYCKEVDPGLFFCDSVDIVPVGQYVEPDGFCSMARK